MTERKADSGQTLARYQASRNTFAFIATAVVNQVCKYIDRCKFTYCK